MPISFEDSAVCQLKGRSFRIVVSGSLPDASDTTDVYLSVGLIEEATRETFTATFTPECT